MDVVSHPQVIEVCDEPSISIEVLSRTQRIIVHPNNSISVVHAGPIGPAGVVLTENLAANGVQSWPSPAWVMDHNLGYRPAAHRFFDETGQEWEPEEIIYVNDNREIAQWPEPMSGSWFVS